MPAKGTRKLTDKQKVEIVVAKQLKPRGTSTNVQLASELDVKPNTIAKAKYDTLTETQKELYEQTIANLKYDSADLTANSLKKANELVQIAESTRDLAGVVAAGKFAHDVFRLETGQATQINGSPLETDNFKCQRFIDTVLDIEKNGKRLSLDEAYEVLLSADMGVEEAIKVRFVEGLRGKRQQIAE
jgi:hypothetical protein